MPSTAPVPLRFAIVPLANFTMTDFSGFIDTLRLTADEGDFSKPVRCTWKVLGETMEPVRSSCGVAILPWDTLETVLKSREHFDYIVFIGGLLHQGQQTGNAMLEQIRRAAKTDATLVGICTGTFALYRAGVLDNHKMCVSWFHYWDFLERFPDCDEKRLVADRLFVMDRRRITCSGGRASIDVAAAILSRHFHASLVQKTLRILQVDELSHVTTPQPHPPGTEPSDHPKIRRAVLLMEQNLAGGLQMTDLAQKLNMSSRQLERLFKTCTGQSPQNYARSLRLRAATWLLTNSGKSISHIATACGFPDASPLGREFRKVPGQSPKVFREQNRQQNAMTLEDAGLFTVPNDSPAVTNYREVFPARTEFH